MDDTRQYSILYFFSLQKCKKRHLFQPFHFNDLSPQMHSAFAHILIIILSACCIIICITLIIMGLYNNHTGFFVQSFPPHIVCDLFYACICQYCSNEIFNQLITRWVNLLLQPFSLCFLCIYIYRLTQVCVCVTIIDVWQCDFKTSLYLSCLEA